MKILSDAKVINQFFIINCMMCIISILALCQPCFAGETSQPSHTNQDIYDYNQRIPPGIVNNLKKGIPQRVIVTIDWSAIRAETLKMRQSRGLAFNNKAINAYQSEQVAELNNSVLANLDQHDYVILAKLIHVPTLILQIDTYATLQRLLNDPRVIRVYRADGGRLRPESNPDGGPADVNFWGPQINLLQAQFASGESGGAGQTIAVIDEFQSGLPQMLQRSASCFDSYNDYNVGCSVGSVTLCYTSYGYPLCSSCTMNQDNYTCGAYTEQFDNGTNDHLNTVAGMIAAAAINANLEIIAIIPDSNGFVNDANLADALDHVTDANTVNISLGSQAVYASQCPGIAEYQELTNLETQGVFVAAAAGNSGTLGLSEPACYPGVTSVGSVYDDAFQLGTNPAEVMPFLLDNGQYCQDSTELVNQVPCFSNWASFLSLAAPGCLVYFVCGTSVSAPLVSATAAVLRAVRPSDPVYIIRDYMTTSGTPITYVGIKVPALNMLAAVDQAIAANGGSPIPSPPPLNKPPGNGNVPQVLENMWDTLFGG